jgi:hypothetical protein
LSGCFVDVQLKRSYLVLLPTAQLVDLCLSLDKHVPEHIRPTLWPSDIQTAVDNLQRPQATSSPSPLPATEPNPTSSPPSTNRQDETTATAVSEDAQSSNTAIRDLAAVLQAAASAQRETSPPVASSSTAPSVTDPQTQSTSTAPQRSKSAQPAYPHIPFYSMFQNAYPSQQSPYTPYLYGPYGGAPPAPPPLSNMYAHMYPSTSADRRDMLPEDLPSYEDMICEALADIKDPEGCMPRILFLWMSDHYPLQVNFRPSASQALQKAFKRGRLLKGTDGKYKLNPDWSGGGGVNAVFYCISLSLTCNIV